MGDSAPPSEGYPKRSVTCCPICGAQLPSDQQPERCFSCQFQLTLLSSPQEVSVPKAMISEVPRFALAMLAIQAIVAGFTGVLFFLLANPYYLSLAQIIAAMQVISIFFLTALGILLKFQKAVFLVRIALVILGIFSLPLGIFAVAAALSIIPLRQWCIICKKQIGFASALDCPHCQATMHRWGRCRNERIQRVVSDSDYDFLPSQIEYICPRCWKAMNQNSIGGTADI